VLEASSHFFTATKYVAWSLFIYLTNKEAETLLPVVNQLLRPCYHFYFSPLKEHLQCYHRPQKGSHASQNAASEQGSEKGGNCLERAFFHFLHRTFLGTESFHTHRQAVIPAVNNVEVVSHRNAAPDVRQQVERTHGVLAALKETAEKADIDWE
jgi:hypothetical protein